jgi:drug/metabolite transporter (DMT)-like permease
LLNQCIIPATIVASYFFLKERIHLTQGIGATCILIGASVSFLPALVHPTAGASTTTGILIYIMSLVPSASSNVFKEACFRSKTDEMAVDVNLLSAIVAIFQVVLGFCFMPILATPAFGGLPFSELPNQMKLGFKCFLGQGTLVNDHVCCAGCDLTPPPPPPFPSAHIKIRSPVTIVLASIGTKAQPSQ